MTDERLAELDRLCEAATPGEWLVEDSSRQPEVWTSPDGVQDWRPGETLWSILNDEDGYALIHGTIGRPVGLEQTLADLDLMAAARTALPELLAEVRRLREELTAVGLLASESYRCP